MTISTSSTITLSANGTSDWVRLPMASANTLAIYSTNWAGSQLSFQFSVDATAAKAVPLPDPDSPGSPYATSSNDSLIVDGSGYVRATLSSYGGTPVTFAVSRNTSDLTSIANKVVELLSGVRPTATFSFDPVTFAIRLVQGDDYLADDERYIDIPVVLPAGVDPELCTATFGAKNSESRIDAQIEVFIDTEDSNAVYARIVLADTITASATPGRYAYQIEFQCEGSNITVVSGQLTLVEGIALDISEFE